MKIFVVCSHIGSEGFKPSKQHGGGELHTFAFLDGLNRFYDVTAVIPNGFYPAFDQAHEYGIDLRNLHWRPIGDDISYLREADIMMSINHAFLPPPIARRNILAVFFPQYPQWDVSGYDTIVANSRYTAKWAETYWGKKAEVVYPPIQLKDFYEKGHVVIESGEKKRQIVSVGRFFEVPGGNNKNHMVLIDAFKNMMDPDATMVLIGSIQDNKYYDKVRAFAGNDKRITFLHDIDRQEYVRIVSESMFIWGATGYKALKPSSREHFGIFPVEGMAAGAIPIVHHSGGTPETGALTWETPEQLISITKSLIENETDRTNMAQAFIQQSAMFLPGAQIAKLVEIIENPVIIPPSGEKSKIFVSYPPLRSITVAWLSDSPIITTGFAQISRSVGLRLMKMGVKIVYLGMQDPFDGRPQDDKGFNIWRGDSSDPNGFSKLKDMLEESKANVVFMNYDVANVNGMIHHLRNIQKADIPIVAYVPIEGAPIPEGILATLRWLRTMNSQVILYTDWASKQVLEEGGPRLPYVHHGVDHANFGRPDPEHREKLRKAIGWEGKYVIMFLGRNKRTKGIPALLDTAKILESRHPGRFLFYIHTDPDDGIQNSSFPLRQMVEKARLNDVVIFPDLIQTRGIPYDEPITGLEVPDTDDLNEIYAANLRTLSLTERYQCCDVFVNLSEVGGFEMPPVEAMANARPVVSVDDNGVMKEVLGDAPIYVRVAHWDTWHTGARLAQVDPRDVARAIEDLSANHELQEELSQASLGQAAKYSWDKTTEVIAEAIQKAVAL